MIGVYEIFKVMKKGSMKMIRRSKSKTLPVSALISKFQYKHVTHQRFWQLNLSKFQTSVIRNILKSETAIDSILVKEFK